MNENNLIKRMLEHLKNPYDSCRNCKELIEIKPLNKDEFYNLIQEKYKTAFFGIGGRIKNKLDNLKFKDNSIKLNEDFLTAFKYDFFEFFICEHLLKDRQRFLSNDKNEQIIYTFLKDNLITFKDLDFNCLEFVNPYRQGNSFGRYYLTSLCPKCLKGYKKLLINKFIADNKVRGYLCPYNNDEIVYNCISKKEKIDIERKGNGYTYLPKQKILIDKKRQKEHIVVNGINDNFPDLKIRKVIYDIKDTDFKILDLKKIEREEIKKIEKEKKEKQNNSKKLKSLGFKDIIFEDSEYIFKREIIRKHSEVIYNLIEKGKRLGYETEGEYKYFRGKWAYKMDCIWLDNAKRKVGFEVALTSSLLKDITKLKEGNCELNVLIVNKPLDTETIKNIVNSGAIKEFPKKLMIYNIFSNDYIIPSCLGNYKKQKVHK